MKELKTMFNWNSEKIYWNIVCSETNDMNDKICEKIKYYIKDKNIAEFGCGTGYFALSMSKYANLIIAADIQNMVLEVLQQNIEKNNIRNIIPLKTDIYNNEFHNIDYVVAKFFSKPTRDIKTMLSMARQGLILIVNTTSYSGMNEDEISKSNKENAAIICPYLEKENMKYTKIDMECENGQYVRDEEEAIRFLKSYTKNTDDEIKKILSKSRLEQEYKALDQSFSHFVSVDKKISIFIIEKQL